MTNYLLVLSWIGLLAFGCSGPKQQQSVRTNESSYSSFYPKAINYIRQDRTAHEYVQQVTGRDELEVEVSNSIEYLKYVYFAEEILKDRLGAEDFDLQIHYQALESISDSLDQVDRARNFEQYTLEDLDELSTARNAKVKLFFSKPYKNTLAAELLISHHSDEKYRRLTTLNTGLRFLFRFNSDGDIEKAYTTEISYN